MCLYKLRFYRFANENSEVKETYCLRTLGMFMGTLCLVFTM